LGVLALICVSSQCSPNRVPPTGDRTTSRLQASVGPAAVPNLPRRAKAPAYTNAFSAFKGTNGPKTVPPLPGELHSTVPGLAKVEERSASHEGFSKKPWPQSAGAGTSIFRYPRERLPLCSVQERKPSGSLRDANGGSRDLAFLAFLPLRFMLFFYAGMAGR